MPYTRRQIRFLLSKVSPFSSIQKDKLKAELHENPALGHRKKGSLREIVSLSRKMKGR